MNIIDINNQSGLPNFLFSQPPCVTGFPYVAEIGDLWGKAGSGIGNSVDSAHAAMGEYFERRHFYMEIYPTNKSLLSATLTDLEVQRFCDAFYQTAEGLIERSFLYVHEFGMTKANRISDFSECYIPTTILAIHNDNSEDDRIYPVKDTCGCSFHQKSEVAMFGSLKESLERQFLTRFWLTGNCAAILSSEQISQHLSKSSSSPLFECLRRAGIVEAIDITDARFPGSCIILVYGCADATRTVKYCAGMSYSETLCGALEKSLLELWQTYRFIDLFNTLGTTSASSLDPYLRHFLKSNDINTYREMMNVSVKKIAPIAQKTSYTQFNLGDLIKTLRSNCIEGYFYTNKIRYQDTYYTFSKFISPSLFMHMNNSRSFNLLNQYSESFNAEIIPCRLATMVPFP